MVRSPPVEKAEGLVFTHRHHTETQSGPDMFDHYDFFYCYF